jgi:hypothetical protein
MSRRESEQKALDIIAGRAGDLPVPVAKSKMSGIGVLSLCLWLAAVAVIGSLGLYVYLKFQMVM